MVKVILKIKPQLFGDVYSKTKEYNLISIEGSEGCTTLTFETDKPIEVKYLLSMI